MRQFTIAAAVLTAFVALLASAPAQADHGGGPEVRAGQCFIYGPTMGRDGRFGVWGACPQTASVAAAPRQIRRHRSNSR